MARRQWQINPLPIRHTNLVALGSSRADFARRPNPDAVDGLH